jgi:hypothetical protein
VLLLLSLCVAFPRAQQKVIDSRRTEVLMLGTRSADRAPEHDWRRVGGGTTRAVASAQQSGSSLIRLAAASPFHIPLPTKTAGGAFSRSQWLSPAIGPTPRRPLRI